MFAFGGRARGALLGGLVEVMRPFQSDHFFVKKTLTNGRSGYKDPDVESGWKKKRKTYWIYELKTCSSRPAPGIAIQMPLQEEACCIVLYSYPPSPWW